MFFDATADTASPPVQDQPAKPPGSRIVGWIGVACVVLPLLSLAISGWTQYRGMRDTTVDRLELLATVLEDHATRTVDATANTLSALADNLGSRHEQESAAQINPLLAQSMVSLPALRSIALVDLGGQVLGSTRPAEVGLKIDLALLGPIPDPGKDSLGPLVLGSGLMRLGEQNSSMEGGSGAASIPLIRHVRTNTGRGLLLIGVLNPDSFASYQQLTVKDEHTAALLTSYDGTVLATLPWVAISPGSRLQQHPLFSDFGMQQRERGNFEGLGARQGIQLTAFRISHNRPLVMLVEQPRQVLIQQWWDQMLPYALGRLLIIAGFLALTWYVRRLLLRHERIADHQETVRGAVANRERELGELFKLVPELIFRTSKPGAITFINGRYSDVTGHTNEHALGRLLADLVLPASRTAVQALFDPERGRSPRRAQALIEGSYGIERRFDITVMPLYDGEQLHAFAGSAVDLTERLLLQDKLRGQVEFTGRLLELCPVPVSIVDEESRFLTVNKAWEQLNMRSRNEVLGRVAGEHWPLADRAAQRQVDEQLLKTGGSYCADLIYTRIDQSRREMRVTKVAVAGEDGKPTAVLNTFVDLTEFRDAERATAQARKAAEDVSRMKSEFIASVSHQLRTPLQSILGFTEIGLARTLTRERQIDLFSEIEASGASMLMMVNDLLDFTKIGQAELPQEQPLTDLCDTVETVKLDVADLLAPKCLLLELNLGNRPLIARIEPLRARQLMHKLLTNAIDVSPPGGVIEVIGIPFGAEVQVQVRDQGPSIPEAELQHIFDPFAFAGAIRGQPETGTGLGLAICRRIAVACGGSLHALNRPEGGVSFDLKLPAAVVPQAARVSELATL